MDKKHVISNAHKQVESLMGMWNCCGITAVEAAQILSCHVTHILKQDIAVTNFELNKPTPGEAFKQWQKDCDVIFDPKRDGKESN